MEKIAQEIAGLSENVGCAIGECFQADVEGQTFNVADGLRSLALQFTSPNESDRNLEQANVVDGLFAIARAITRLAVAVETHAIRT